MEHVIKILAFILNSFIHIWPYLVITIPLAVLVKLTSVSNIISRALSRNPLISILLATMLGAFSPFCSCGVIPVITSLLIGGVPLAPVMSFWIASPSIDPEVFFLSVASIGWELSLWRLVATCLISLSAGYITHLAVRSGFIGQDVIRTSNITPVSNLWKNLWDKKIKRTLYRLMPNWGPRRGYVQLNGVLPGGGNPEYHADCCIQADLIRNKPGEESGPGRGPCNGCKQENSVPHLSLKKVWVETWKATALVLKFMALAFLINAIITMYLPDNLIPQLLGGNSSFSVIIASLIGIPVYTSNVTALPLVGGLLELGMNRGAALAFLVVGPITTLPAMAAVWGIVKRKVFLMYLFFSLIGGIVFGYLYLILA